MFKSNECVGGIILKRRNNKTLIVIKKLFYDHLSD
jgi:hypothetical protein